MPTKELLSAVFGRTVSDVKLLSENEIGYYFYDKPRARLLFWEIPYHTISIYELAYKCKEWAFDEGFVLKSYKRQGAFSETYHYAIDINEKICEWLANTEHEAIFKACEWILKQTHYKDNRWIKQDKF